MAKLNSLLRWTLVEKLFAVMGIFYTATTVARWIYIFRGIDYSPLEAIEKEALRYFRERKERKNKEANL